MPSCRGGGRGSVSLRFGACIPRPHYWFDSALLAERSCGYNYGASVLPKATQPAARRLGQETIPMTEWTLDAAHANVEFSIKHMMITTIRGRFQELALDVVFDEQTERLPREWRLARR